MTVKPSKVLLIEDNPGDVRLIREMLSESKNISFEIEHADRLSSGLESLAQGGLDILLLDLGLPDSQGFETVRRILPAAPGIPVIVLTGLNDEAMGLQAIHEGAQDYLVKGEISFPVISRAINYAIERQKLLNEIKVLRGMLPICSYCKKIRDDKGYWKQVESYVSEHTEAVFSHGICPDCEKKAYAELEKLKKERNL